MNVSQKLQLIQKLSGLTQERLAQKIGVSFAAFNSWFNNKSTPRKNNQERIDELYSEWTGQKIIPEDILQAKKQIIKNKSRKLKNVLKTIFDNPDIYDQFILSLTYHTNSMEGNSLSEPETAAVLFQNIALPNKDLIEQLEVKNHQAALQYLFRYISRKKKIDQAFVLKLHSILMNGIREDAGKYRRHSVRIVGANVPTANYLKVPTLIREIVEDVNRQEKDTISHIASIHSHFEQIHPFSDGNGRVGRLLMHAMLLRKNLAPAIIRKQQKRLYNMYLSKCQRKGESSQLEDFLCDAVLEGFKILERD